MPALDLAQHVRASTGVAWFEGGRALLMPAWSMVKVRERQEVETPAVHLTSAVGLLQDKRLVSWRAVCLSTRKSVFAISMTYRVRLPAFHARDEQFASRPPVVCQWFTSMVTKRSALPIVGDNQSDNDVPAA
jgi:hypothetical protein